MRIVEVSATALKGQTFTQRFTGCDLLIGPNGAGKTTRGPLAITAALEGLATTPTDARRPYVGDVPEGASVRLTLSDGRTVKRELRVGPPTKASRAADALAAQLVGVPPTAWDLRDFSTTTDGQRSALVDAIARASGHLDAWTVSAAQMRTREIMSERDGVSLEELDGLIEWLPDAVGAAEWVSAGISRAEGRQSQTRAAAEQAHAGISAAEHRLQQHPRPDRSVDELREERAALVASQTSAADVARERAALARHVAEGERLGATLERLQASGQQMRETAPSTIPQLEQRVARLRAAMDAPVPGGSTAEEVAEAQAAERRQHERLREVEAQLDELRAQQSETQHTYLQAREAAITAERAIPSEVADTCRHCGGHDPLGHAEDRPERVAAHARAVEALDAAQVAAEGVSGRVATATRRVATLRVAYDRARLVLEDVRARQVDPDAIIAARRRELAAAEGELARERERWEAAEARRERDLESLRRDYAQARDALAEWEATPAPQVSAVADRSAELAEIDAQLAAHARHEERLEELRQAGDRAMAAQTAAESARWLLRALRQVRDEIASAAYAPIEAAAQRLMEGAQGLPVPFIRGPGDYGAITRHGGEVQYGGLSESEQRLTAAALAYALAVVRGQPVRVVLLDGLEVVQRDLRAPLMAALARAVERGDVANVVATCIERVDAPGVRVWELA